MIDTRKEERSLVRDNHDKHASPPEAMLSRAQGCLLGQLAGDALGSLVEFQTPDAIRRQYPAGVREMSDGGSWDTIAGQPTDDSEMALSLARMLVEKGGFDPEAARAAYVSWLESGPFDCGGTVRKGLAGRPDTSSQANGALMRISPLGIFGANHPIDKVAEWAAQDAAITHPHPVCQQASSLFAMAIAHGIRNGCTTRDLYAQTVGWARERAVEASLLEALHIAAKTPPEDFNHQQGWVLIAFQNAFWQLLHAPSLEEGIVDSVMRGGDTDTNAAICGAILGAVHGREAVPDRWIDTLLDCRPSADNPDVHQPRPEHFWPVDALELAEGMISPRR